MNADKMNRIAAAIDREYDLKRQDAARLLYQRKQEVFEKVPGYRELSEKVPSNAVKLLSQILDEEKGDIDRSQIKSRLNALSVKEEKRSLLTQYGYPEDYLDPQYECSLCKDTGYVRDESGLLKERCRCFRSRLSHMLAQDSGLMELLSTENFDNLKEDYYEGEDLNNFKRAERAVREFAKEGDYRNFFFYGNIGTGKSFLSCCAAKELLDRGYEVLYYSASTLFDMLAAVRQRSGRDDAFEDQGMDRVIYECDLLILDDLGTEWFNSFVFSQLFSLINERIINKRSTIISTNLTLKDLSDIYSERLLSRISENYMLCKLTGSDIRMEKVRRGYSTTP
ncbi:MAG: ATP-binding protein [Lachnospiraceae bacterium]|nr:ATP-binding protein [Lachnospiraceae bacterium]